MSFEGQQIRGTLAISKAEALTGTSRTLNLPSGRQVRVSLPVGAYNGQVIRLEGQGEPSNAGGPVGTLLLTITVVDTEESDTTALSDRDRSALDNDATVLSGSDSLTALPNRGTSTINNQPFPSISQGNTTPISSQQPTPIAHSNIAPVSNQPAPSISYDSGPVGNQRRTLSRNVAIGLVLLLIVSSIGLVYVSRVLNPNPPPAVNTNATAQANNTATASAQGNTSATATPTAQATVTAIASPHPYGGTLVLNDPMTDNSNGNGWDEKNSNGNACQFTGGAYHVTAISNYGNECLARSTNFSNFALQAQMTLVRNGQHFSGFGIDFRSDGNSNEYQLVISERGAYYLTICKSTPPNTDCSKALVQGTIQNFRQSAQPNLIAIVAKGTSIDLYVNNQHIALITDSTYTHGEIGFTSTGGDSTAEVVVKDVKVWAL